ncbi:ENTH domain containing protein [Nitzschia inconspicua]|uniref:ENTH domain containing protein n=1 Tax=Nitzschia inconspicua TaxID=303405 RepID=A0A9K3LKF6_9STRA|nr:ENTH domain containing protein [Nitzschia inconspicua]
MNFLAGTSIIQPTTATIADKQLRPLLFDESIQVLSTFELNQMASLTYNDVTCDDMFQLIERICSKPLDHTPLSIQKALVVTKHVLIYGQEKTVNHGYGLQDYFKALTTFNTVLMTQQQGGALAFFQSIQGGGVDKGGPVRQAAEDLVQLLSNINELQRIRNASASQESLVPVGDDKVAFVTDEVRHHILKQRIAKERQIQIKSNLAKADNGFGAGYSASDGKSVVGAAHGIEEMIKIAKLQKQSFSDDNSRPPGYKTEEERILEELQAEAEAAKAASQSASAPEPDLLGFGTMPTTTAPEKEVDLLGFHGTTISSSSSSAAAAAPYQAQIGDLLGGSGLGYTSTQATSDPFGLGTISSSVPATGTGTMNHSLLDLGMTHTVPAPALDPFASLGGPISNNTPLSMTQQSTVGEVNSLASAMTTMGLGMSSLTNTAQQQQQQPPPTMGSAADRFAALDALAATNPPPTTNSDALAAESKIMAFSSSLNTDDVGFNPITATLNYNSHYQQSGLSMSSSTSSAAATADLYSYMPTTTGMGMPSLPPLPVPDNMIRPGSGHVAKSYGDVGDHDAEDNPWVMGGAAGTGLQPVGPAPGTAPPPPPPTF